MQALYNTAEAASRLKTTPTTLRIARQTGKLWGVDAPHYLKAGSRKVVYRESDLVDFLNRLAVHKSVDEIVGAGGFSGE